MPILGVCGDSFMAASINCNHTPCIDSEGKHFTEILAKKLNYDYFTLARGACSNTAIRLQISEMIKRKVDLVIIGTTSPNRLEIPNIGKKFKPELGVYNLDYRLKYYPDKSALNQNFQHNLITETLTNIFVDTRPFFKKIFNIPVKNFMPPFVEEQLNALEYYIDYLYDENYKRAIDGFIIQSAVKALEDSKIPFVIIFNGINLSKDLINLDTNTDSRFIDIKSPLNPAKWEKQNRRWHTSDKANDSGAELWYNYLIENKFIQTH